MSLTRNHNPASVGRQSSLLLSWIFVRAITRPIQSLTRTAERLAKGDYDGPAPTAAEAAGGELGVLAGAMMHMAGEVKARVGELTEQRDLLSVVFGGLVEGVLVVEPGGAIALANDAARPLLGEEAQRLPDRLAPLVARARLPQVDPEPALGSPQLVQRQVGRNGEEPCDEPALGSVAAAEAEHLDEDVLGHLLGARAVAEQPLHILEDSRTEPLEQLAKSRLVVGLYAEHEGDVRVGGGGLRRLHLMRHALLLPRPLHHS